MNFHHEAEEIVTNISDGKMSSIAYDTSWFVRLKNERGELRFPSALHWVLTHQHSDGSWGAAFETYYDRLISTLAVVNALAITGEEYRSFVDRGIDYIHRNAAKLRGDQYETIGFELLFPMLLDEAQELDLQLPYEAFEFVRQVGARKLSLTPREWMYQPETPLVHNLEFMSQQIDVEKAARLLEVNGSVGNSPSASAFLAQYIRDPKLDTYLSKVVAQSDDGGACNVNPFEVFEIAWTYYNFQLAGLRIPAMERGIQYLASIWKPGGVGISASGLLADADDSALVLKVLRMAGVDQNYDFLQYYESERGFLCFPFERNPSLSTNIHILDALNEFDDPTAEAAKQKIRDFLRESRTDGRYWRDKWHASPYYATSHAVLALGDSEDELVRTALNWIMETQREDGSWGVFGGTAEETAYCVQALLTAGIQTESSCQSNLKRAVEYLSASRNETFFPELWIGKGLYSPIHVIQSSVFSALALYEKQVGARV